MRLVVIQVDVFAGITGGFTVYTAGLQLVCIADSLDGSSLILGGVISTRFSLPREGGFLGCPETHVDRAAGIFVFRCGIPDGVGKLKEGGS